MTVESRIEESGQPLSCVDAKQKYDLTNSHVIHWLGLIKSIPRSWKNILCTNHDGISADIQNQINNVSPCITSKIAQQKLLKQFSGTSNGVKVIEKNAPTGRY